MSNIGNVYNNLSDQEYNLVLEYNKLSEEINRQKLIDNGNFDLQLEADRVMIDAAIKNINKALANLRAVSTVSQ